jgi:regulator of protease activity HflC (stomatin/prohibitin superfamily)
LLFSKQAEGGNVNTNKRVWNEIAFASMNGYVMTLIALALIVAAAALFIQSPAIGGALFFRFALILGGAFLLGGLYMLQPNEGALITLFGDYRGTDRASGLRWCMPFYGRKKISLRSRNLNGEKLKVNDKSGNPIEIAAAIVWRVEDTAQAVYEIDDYDAYVHIQSEAAVRHVASSYHYDNNENDANPNEITLRGGTTDVARALIQELQERLGKAGVVVEEARLTHLAYAPEIASAMLRRQQAEAVIAARSKIVHGAVTMVEMALAGLSEKNIVELDNERKAAMVSNLLVVLCAESNVQPIVNTGTLYT